MIPPQEYKKDYFQPDYEFWLRKESWTVEESCFLLLGIDPRFFDETSSKSRRLECYSSEIPKEIEEKFNNSPSIRRLENEFDLTVLELCEELNSNRFKNLLSNELDPERVMYWAFVEKGLKLKSSLKSLLQKKGLSKNAPVGDFKDLEVWFSHDSWTIEEAVLLIRGFSPDAHVFWICFRSIEDLVHKAIAAKKIVGKSKDPSQIRGDGRLDRFVNPKEFTIWAKEKGLVVNPSLFDKLLNQNELSTFQDSSRERPSKIDKFVVQAIARCLWDQNPTSTIVSVINHKWIQKFGNGSLYKGKNTLRNWVSEVDPRPEDSKRGRPPKPNKK